MCVCWGGGWSASRYHSGLWGFFLSNDQTAVHLHCQWGVPASPCIPLPTGLVNIICNLKYPSCILTIIYYKLENSKHILYAQKDEVSSVHVTE